MVPTRSPERTRPRLLRGSPAPTVADGSPVAGGGAPHAGALTGPCGSGKEATRKAQNRGRGYLQHRDRSYLRLSELARSGPGAARASLMSIFPQTWIQGFARERGILFLDSVLCRSG